MKNIVPCILVFFLLLCTSCNTDDTAIPSYTKITEEQKELLLGDWQLIKYSNLENEEINLLHKGLLVRWTFKKEGTVTIENASSKPILYTDHAQYLTSDRTIAYVFDYIKQWDKEIAKKERLYFQDEGQSSIEFDLDVINQDELILTHQGEETFVFKRLPKGMIYPSISEEDKKLLLGTWRLQEITYFTGKKRVLKDNEEVLYTFSNGGRLTVNNRSASMDGVFDDFIQSRLSVYSYQYDLIWQEREILLIEGLGDYAMGVSDKRLAFSQYDGAFILFERVK